MWPRDRISKKWTCGQKPCNSYTGYAIALQDAEVFIKGIKYTNCEIGHPKMQ